LAQGSSSFFVCQAQQDPASKQASIAMQISVISTVLLASVVAANGSFQPARVSFPSSGKSYTLNQLKSGEATIADGSFICILKDEFADKKQEVLARCQSEKSWAPEMAYSDMMPMFAGKMSGDFIKWLLEQPEVKEIEADGKVSIAPAAVSEASGTLRKPLSTNSLEQVISDAAYPSQQSPSSASPSLPEQPGHGHGFLSSSGNKQTSMSMPSAPASGTMVLVAVVGTSLLCCCLACCCIKEICGCLWGSVTEDGGMPFEGGAGDGYGPTALAGGALAGAVAGHYMGDSAAFKGAPGMY